MKYIYYTLQSLLHGRSANVIKIISLALGLLMSVFLFARIAFELSFDNFYKDADRLYVVQTSWVKDGEVVADYNRFTLVPIPATIAEEFPEQVEGSTVSCSLFGDALWLGEEKHELPVVMADTLYFSVLGLEMVEGNPQDLAGPDVVFLSAKSAREVFGGENPVGKTLQYDFFGEKVPMLVKGIFADVPLNSSLQKRPEAVVSFPSIRRHTQWRQGWQSGGNYDGFLRLRSPKDAEWLNERISAVIARHIPADFAYELRGQVAPIRSQHLDDSQVRKMVWVMFFLGIVLLFTTTLNYVLISVASLTRRAKAIGVHKCSGASGGSIFSMFMVETAVVTGIALLLIGVLVYLFRDKMEELAAVPLAVLFGWQNLWAPLAVVVLLLLLGGGLPALLFARIPVTQVFRRYTSGRRGWKRVLLFVQFIGAAFILGMLLTVASQYHYVTARDRGWRPERVAYLYQTEVDNEHLKSALRGQPYVEDVASTRNSLLWFGKNRPVLDNQGNEMFYPRNGWFNTDFLPFIGLKLKEGHNLTGEGQLLVNSAFCEKMQWTDSPIGKQVNGCGTVVGLLASFSFPNLPNDEEPVMMEWAGTAGPHLYVRLKEPFEENLARLNEEMQRMYPQKEFLFSSLEQEMRSYSESVRVFRDVTLLVSLTILFIVLMGLVGYVNDEVCLRSKEIAIRKVNGAETRSILWLLSGDVLWLAVPSVAAGMFGAYKAGVMWVSQFRDMVPLSVAGYACVGVLLLLFIVGSVWVKSWRIANENPVKSIQSE
ncbi:FtsX-like permease family protein [Bacteroides sp.]|uniref:ABC transporter permease n=1 Tax=Bacteroides sp. TaxID=29523 RepID=UPI0023D69E3F|nr:FtsX-like permease family protein [Bacteroides sp.]MDE6217097.1 ABC transporter permease [Bacteroides sp.]